MSLDLDDGYDDYWDNDIWCGNISISDSYSDDIQDYTAYIALQEESAKVVRYNRMQAHLIVACTDLTPTQWIDIYAERFRKIVDENPEFTQFQVWHQLYLWNQNQLRTL